MIYKVVYTEPFRDQVADHVRYLCDQHVSAATIEAWYEKLFERLDSLDELPHRMPVDEPMTALTGQETRKLNHGQHLVFYRVREDPPRVELTHFQHGARERERYAVESDDGQSSR